MKKFLGLVLSVALLPTFLAAANFEGKVSMSVTMPGKPPTDMVFSLKENRSRIDTQMGGNNAGIIMDQGKQEMTILMNSQKMYITRPLPKPSQPGETPAAGTPAMPAHETPQLTSEGPGEKILGYDTTKYLATSKDGTSEIWVTDQLGSFAGMGPGGAGGPPAGRRGAPTAAGSTWDQLIAGRNLFPLRVVSKKNGKEDMRMEATSIQKETLPESTFTPPPDFQKFDLGNMMQGMMQGRGNGSP